MVLTLNNNFLPPRSLEKAIGDIPDFKIGKILGCGGEKYIDNLIEQIDQNGFFLDLSKPEKNCSDQNNDQVSNQRMLEFMAGGPKTRRYRWTHKYRLVKSLVKLFF